MAATYSVTGAQQVDQYIAAGEHVVAYSIKVEREVARVDAGYSRFDGYRLDVYVITRATELGEWYPGMTQLTSDLESLEAGDGDRAHWERLLTLAPETLAVSSAIERLLAAGHKPASLAVIRFRMVHLASEDRDVLRVDAAPNHPHPETVRL